MLPAVQGDNAIKAFRAAGSTPARAIFIRLARGRSSPQLGLAVAADESRLREAPNGSSQFVTFVVGSIKRRRHIGEPRRGEPLQRDQAERRKSLLASCVRRNLPVGTPSHNAHDVHRPHGRCRLWPLWAPAVPKRCDRCGQRSGFGSPGRAKRRGARSQRRPTPPWRATRGSRVAPNSAE